VGSGERDMPPPQKIFEIFMQNGASSCKIFACFKMHPVNREQPPPPHPSCTRHWCKVTKWDQALPDSKSANVQSKWQLN